ncbi:MAG TPA: PP2C family protein-serine/threonine phosphatase, partial [Clostridia bacterium]|nr:PP2C family protein-serine/threonine phosphatase [Clostridia bacterium]
NRLMFEELSNVDMFITTQIAAVDVSKHLLVVASAGHCPLLVTDARREVHIVATQGLPLGILPEVLFTETSIPLSPGSCALFYTDGLTETRNANGDFFGQVRLEDWLREVPTASHSATQLKERFLTELECFRGSTPPTDDLTLLIFKDETQSSAPGQAAAVA